MKQRGVTIIATYLAKRPLGRLVQVRKVGDDDYMLAIEDVRDGRTHLTRPAIWACGSSPSKLVDAFSRRPRSAGGATSSTWSETWTGSCWATASGAAPS